MKKILVFDNYDSFTYNLVQYIERIIDRKVDVFRNDKIGLEAIDKYDKILLSPGPGIPKDAGIMIEVIKRYANTKSIMGVCLGHQAIAEAFGGSLVNYKRVYHGVAGQLNILKPEELLFKGIPDKINVGRYHAWGVETDGLPDCFDITATDTEGHIMAICHKNLDVRGVQFHPESVLTDYGIEMMQNWIEN